MDIRLVIAVLSLGPPTTGVILLCVFYLRHALWRSKKYQRKKKRGFYPTNYALGLAFQTLQLFAEPGPKHVIAEKLKESAEEAAEGDPGNPEKQLEKQLRRIRMGEDVDVLNIPVKESHSGES